MFLRPTVTEDDYGPSEWAEELDITEDLSEDMRQAYHHAYSARNHLNRILDRIEDSPYHREDEFSRESSYSEAAPEERMEIEGEIESRLDRLYEDFHAADNLLRELSDNPDRELNGDDEVALALLAPYQNGTESKLEGLEERIEEETSQDFNPGDISPMARGNYEETMEYIRELEEEFKDPESRLNALMSTF